jgi:FtsH-binding integral membrane protein
LPFVEGSGNERQKKLGVLLSRIIALVILMIMLFIAVYSLGMKNHDSILPVVIILSVVFGVTIVFTILMYRAK